MSEGELKLSLRHQELRRDEHGRAFWDAVTENVTVPPSRVALLLCDVWDRHWSRGATERVDAMVPRLDHLVRGARERGVQVVHAPSDTMEFYADSPARQRMVEAPPVEPAVTDGLPAWLERADEQLRGRVLANGPASYDPPLPVDASDEGSDTGEPEAHRAWHRQHPGIGIDEDRDGISDSGREVYSFLQGKAINHLLLAGVHTNMCVLGRSFAIRQMVRWGMGVALVRDLTDAMYSPLSPPYVGHWGGTRLVIEYIEKFWCPTVVSSEILAPRT